MAAKVIIDADPDATVLDLANAPDSLLVLLAGGGDPAALAELARRQLAHAEAITAAATRATPGRVVMLVTGPPTAGRSELVRRFAAPGDVIADFDAICRELGSTADRWSHPAPVRVVAEQEMQRLFDEVAGMETGRAWLIRSVPVATHRQRLAKRVRADRVIVLKPPVRVLMRRARSEPHPDVARKAIRRWLARYTPSPIDELIESVDQLVL